MKKKRKDWHAKLKLIRNKTKEEAIRKLKGMRDLTTSQEGKWKWRKQSGPATTKDLKLKMPEFKGTKGTDPQVHMQAFESWATLQQLPKADGKACFPQTLKGTSQK